jgi:hypothetical protein
MEQRATKPSSVGSNRLTLGALALVLAGVAQLPTGILRAGVPTEPARNLEFALGANSFPYRLGMALTAASLALFMLGLVALYGRRFFFETFFGLATDGKTNRRGLPNLFQLAVLMREFEDELRLASPPYRVQRLLFAPLAVMGRLLGYLGWYPRYTSELVLRGVGRARAR